MGMFEQPIQDTNKKGGKTNEDLQLRGCETRGLLPATHRHWPNRSLSDHSQTALQTECAEIFLHTSSSGYLEQAE